jgi:hypothetical protein
MLSPPSVGFKQKPLEKDRSSGAQVSKNSFSLGSMYGKLFKELAIVITVNKDRFFIPIITPGGQNCQEI